MARAPVLCYPLGMERLNAALFETLIAWYEENKRTLPWRENATPYRVWVSEIMLQQTRVETVKAYYLRWMEKFPTVEALAAAEEDAVLKAWEGLGYYSRARNLHKAAKIVVESLGGELPADKKALARLPGIGEYTAGAILSIAFGVAEPAVDGNVLRVISRLTADPSDIMENKVRAACADALRPLMPKGKTSSFTQALFELGALICLPGEAYRCDLCPLSDRCLAREKGEQSAYPVKSEKAQKKTEKRTVFVLSHEGKYALRKRPSKGLLANLYELPNVEGALSASDVLSRFGDAGATLVPLPPATHVFTHIVWELGGFLVRLSARPADPDLVWATPEEIRRNFSLPSAFSAYKKFCK